MNNIIHLLKCSHCGKIYKIVDEQCDSFGAKYLVTDFGDKLEVKEREWIIPIDKHTAHIMPSINCIHCKYEFPVDNTKYISTEPWIADKVFTIKGC